MIGFLVAGLIIGALARLFKPGRQNLGLLATLGLGLVGSLIGGTIAWLLGTGSIWELNVLGFVLAAGPITHRWRLLPTWANGQLAFGCYRWHDDRRVFVGEGLDVLTLRAGRIVAITAFLVSDLEAYGLPSTISS